MNYKSRTGQIVSGMAVLIILLGSASASTADNRVQLGINSLKAGDYQTAKQWLESALSRKASHPDLYNALGLTYYKLGDEPLAKRYFTLARETSRRHEAAFYLGKIAERSNEMANAKRWFTAAADQYDDLDVQRAADRALLRLQLGADKASEPLELAQLRRSFVFIAAEASLVDGIINPDDTSGSMDQDTSVSLLAAGSMTLSPHKHPIRWKMGASAYTEKYADLSIYNVDSLGAFTSAGYTSGKHQLETKLTFARIYLDGSPYLDQTEVSLKDTLKLDAGNRVVLRARYINVTNPEEQYEYYSGQLTELGSELRGGGELAWRIGLTLRREDRADLTTRVSNDTGETLNRFTSYSRDWAQLKGRLSWNWANRWKQQVEASYRYADYHDPDLSLADSSDTALTAHHRTTGRVKLKAQLTRQVSSHLDIHFAVQHLEDDSNNNVYDFSSQTLSTGLSYVF